MLHANQNALCPGSEVSPTSVPSTGNWMTGSLSCLAWATLVTVFTELHKQARESL